MLLDYKTVFKDFDGEPLLDVNVEPITARVVMVEALIGPIPCEMSKADRYELALRLYHDDNVQITAEAIEVIAKLVDEMYNPMIVGQFMRVVNDGK